MQPSPPETPEPQDSRASESPKALPEPPFAPALRKVLLGVGLPVLIVAVALGGFKALSALQKPPDRHDQPPAVPQVRVMTLTPRRLPLELVGYGAVKAKHKVSLAPQISGRVARVNPAFEVGRFVRKGTVLAEIEPEDYQIRVTTAKARIDQARSEVERLKQTRENLQQEIEVQSKMVDLALAESNRTEEAYLENKAAVTLNVRDASRIAYLRLRATLVDLQNQLALIPQQLQQAEAQLAQRQAEWEQAKLDLERTRIVAPFDARVMARDVEVGQFVTTFPLTGVATLADTQRYEIPVMVEPEQMTKLGDVPEQVLPPDVKLPPAAAQGAVADIRWLAHGGKFTWKGRLARIGMMDEGTSTIPLYVEVEEPWTSLKPGEHPPLIIGAYCQVRIEGRAIEDALAIPERALHEDQQVYLLKDGQLEIRTVTVRYRQDDLVVIGSGLNAGDRVVTSPIAFPTPGMALAEAKDDAPEPKEVAADPAPAANEAPTLVLKPQTKTEAARGARP